MINMRFEVPQFIEVEDRIIGPFTWKQFVYLAGGIGTLVVLYLTVPFMIFVVLGLPIGALAGSLAFHRVNNRPFSIFLEAIFNYITKSRLYIWRKDTVQTVTQKTETDDFLKDFEPTTRVPRSQASQSFNINTGNM